MFLWDLLSVEKVPYAANPTHLQINYTHHNIVQLLRMFSKTDRAKNSKKSSWIGNGALKHFISNLEGRFDIKYICENARESKTPNWKFTIFRSKIISEESFWGKVCICSYVFSVYHWDSMLRQLPWNFVIAHTHVV